MRCAERALGCSANATGGCHQSAAAVSPHITSRSLTNVGGDSRILTTPQSRVIDRRFVITIFEPRLPDQDFENLRGEWIPEWIETDDDPVEAALALEEIERLIEAQRNDLFEEKLGRRSPIGARLRSAAQLDQEERQTVDPLVEREDRRASCPPSPPRAPRAS